VTKYREQTVLETYHHWVNGKCSSILHVGACAEVFGVQSVLALICVQFGKDPKAVKQTLVSSGVLIGHDLRARFNLNVSKDLGYNNVRTWGEGGAVS